MLNRMPTVDQLLRTPEGRSLTLVAGPWDARGVEAVTIVDAIEELGTAPAGAIAVLTRHASSLAAGYELDVALRVGAERRIAALAVYGESTTSITAIRLADRARVALLAVDRDRDLGELAFSIARVIREDAGPALERVAGALDAIAAAEGAGVAAVLSAARTITGAAFQLAPPDARGAPAAVAAPVIVEGAVVAVVAADQSDVPVRAAARLAADAIGRIRAAERRAMRAPARARAEALTELLLAPEQRLSGAIEQAHDLDLAVDGWHVVARVEPARLDAAFAAIAGSELGWHAARVESTLVLLRSWDAEPGAGVVAAEAAQVVDRLRAELAEATVHCGLAGPRSGVDGLRTCAEEARAALHAARALRRPNVPVPIDAVALPRTLVEWLTSDAGELAMQRLLEPLDALGPARAATAVRTLQAYLDEQGSLVRCAERLHLHRNAVAYRMRGIRDRLDIDLDDPDQRLALQLACRSRLLARDG
jgi:sugar diacid utilization regulator